MEIKQRSYIDVEMGTEKLKHRPVIIGSGPAGLFAALVLAQRGFNPIMLERGLDVDNRTNDIDDFWNNRKFKNNSNVQFGEGGAGTFSDGKLLTRINDSFKKIIVVEKSMKPRRDDKGYVMMGVKEFLLDKDSLEA